jgi:hypothetical protein
MTRLAAIALLAFLCALPARADQAADTLMRLNLIGRWAVDCADPDRGISYAVAADGSAVYGNPIGSFPILAVTAAGREVTVTIRFSRPVEEVRLNGFTIVDGNTVAPVMNRNERNEYTVRDGILLRTGSKMPALHRCAGPRLS